MRGGGNRWWALVLGAALSAALVAAAVLAPVASAAGLAAAIGAAAGLGALAGIQVEGRRRRADARFFEMANDLLVEASLDGYFLRLSDQWEAVFGWTRDELTGRPFRDFIHPDDLNATNVYADALDQAPGEVFNFENRYRAKDGSYRWLLWTARSDDRRKYAVARDITERKALEHERQELLRQLEVAATTDALTGLPNRRAWDAAVPAAVVRALAEHRPLSVAMVDLDDFKPFNDARGHSAGDALLAEASACWRMALRVADLLVRYGGDEFAVLLPDCPPGEAEAVLERLRASTPGGRTCSVGVAHLEPGADAAGLVAAADAALYEAKRLGRDRVVAVG